MPHQRATASGTDRRRRTPRLNEDDLGYLEHIGEFARDAGPSRRPLDRAAPACWNSLQARGVARSWQKKIGRWQ